MLHTNNMNYKRIKSKISTNKDLINYRNKSINVMRNKIKFRKELINFNDLIITLNYIFVF